MDGSTAHTTAGHLQWALALMQIHPSFTLQWSRNSSLRTVEEGLAGTFNGGNTMREAIGSDWGFLTFQSNGMRAKCHLSPLNLHSW